MRWKTDHIDPGIRWKWLKFMYLYKIISAGLLGLGVIIAPDSMISMMGWPLQNPVVFGVYGDVHVAFDLVSY